MTFFKTETPKEFKFDEFESRAQKAFKLLQTVYYRDDKVLCTPKFYPLPSGHILINFKTMTKAYAPYRSEENDSVLAIVNPDAKIATKETVKEIYRHKEAWFSNHYSDSLGLRVDYIDADGVISFHTEFHDPYRDLHEVNPLERIQDTNQPIVSQQFSDGSSFSQKSEDLKSQESVLRKKAAELEAQLEGMRTEIKAIVEARAVFQDRKFTPI